VVVSVAVTVDVERNLVVVVASLLRRVYVRVVRTVSRLKTARVRVRVTVMEEEGSI